MFVIVLWKEALFKVFSCDFVKNEGERESEIFGGSKQMNED